jgi:penicillin-binding protein 2B
VKKSTNSIKIDGYILVAVAAFFALIIAKLIYVAASPSVDGIDLHKFALSRTTATKTIYAKRGSIYDVAGEVLAQDVRSYTVVAYLSASRTTDITHPQHVVDKQMTAEALSPLINMSVESILKMLNADLYQVELGPGGRDITELLKQNIEELDLPGIGFIKSTKRDYPMGDFASYLIGYAKKNDDDEIVGELGIEGKYNSELKGTNGKTIYQKDAYGYKIANTPESTTEALDGYDIYLTLDSNIQLYLENAVSEFEDAGIDWVTMTIANAKTGAIVASASSPSFNPNTLNIKNYENPLTSYVYEPGSTMKIFSFMAAIEEGIYDGEEEYQSGSIPVDGFKISDWNTKGWGKINFDTGFTYSSNVAAVLLAQKLGKDKLYEYYEKFGFGKKTDIELPNEYTGKIEFYYGSELASASFGQGITTTPIQNIQALTSITNNGVVLKPYIVSKIVNTTTNEVVYEGKRTEVGKVVRESTVQKIIDLMDKTVNGDDNAATGKKYHTDAVRLIGKTGTAQYTNSNGKYASGQYANIRSFAGIFPKEDPQYIIYLSVKRFQSPSSTMGTIVKKVVESVAKYKNLSYRESNTDNNKIQITDNYLNKSVNDAKSLIESKGLTPIVIGDGDTVIGQYPNKSTSVLVGSKVFINTNGSNIIMPNVINWTSGEFISFANLAHLSYNINGYGNIVSSSVNEGETILPDTIINIELKE